MYQNFNPDNRRVHTLARPHSEAEASIEGQRHAEAWLFTLKTYCGTGDELHRTLETLIEAGDRNKLRGFCRTLQKALERAR